MITSVVYPLWNRPAVIKKCIKIYMEHESQLDRPSQLLLGGAPVLGALRPRERGGRAGHPVTGCDTLWEGVRHVTSPGSRQAFRTVSKSWAALTLLQAPPPRRPRLGQVIESSEVTPQPQQRWAFMCWPRLRNPCGACREWRSK